MERFGVFVVHNAEAKIQEMVHRIVELFHPLKIILFGSRARGDAAPDSDADILIIMNVRGSRRVKAAEIETALAGMGLPKDVLIVTPREFKLYRDVVGTIIYPAAREGKVLYERAA